MNSIITAKLISTKDSFAGRTWFYNFRELTSSFEGARCKKVADSLYKRFTALTKTWDSEKNSEWICRHYLALKMICSSTLTLNSLEHAEDTNLRVVAPYLGYYSLLSALRAVAYTVPEVPWNNGELMRISHKGAINSTFQHLKNFDKDLADKLKALVLQQKAYRELISYRAPSEGDGHVDYNLDIRGTCTLLVEVAQFNSEILEQSIQKKADPKAMVFLDSYIDKLVKLEIEGITFFDREDAYRLNYLKRKYPSPPNLLHAMTEGHVEDFFGAWTSKDDSAEGQFNPDNWRLIFDIP